MNFESVFKFLLENFQEANIHYALMGGFALHVAGYTRATQDIDFIILKDDASKIKKIMDSLGYDLLHESQDILNFSGKMMKELGKVDYLLAHRQYAKAMLERAQDKEILNGAFMVKVIKPEDLIGLKVQSSSNDPARYSRDMADIEAVLRMHHKDLDLNLIKEYFALFERSKEFEQLLEKIKNA